MQAKEKTLESLLKFMNIIVLLLLRDSGENLCMVFPRKIQKSDFPVDKKTGHANQSTLNLIQQGA